MPITEKKNVRIKLALDTDSKSIVLYIKLGTHSLKFRIFISWSLFLKIFMYVNKEVYMMMFILFLFVVNQI